MRSESAVAGRRLAGALLGGASVAVGVGAHFYLVLIVAIVQGFLRGGDQALGGTEHEHLLSAWALTIYVLITGLLLVALSILARWSWPIVPEKGLLLVLLWLLISAILGALGVCICCGEGPCAIWPRQLFSLAWMIALIAAFAVDARVAGVRALSLGIVVVFSVLALTAPFNPCHWLPEVSWLMFARVTLFHVIWYANRLLRIAESTLYAFYAPHVTRLDMVRSHLHGHTGSESPTITSPQDMLSAWRILGTLTAALHAPMHFRDRLVHPATSQQQRLVSAIFAARSAFTRLNVAATGDTESASPPFIDWKYRHYSHNYMIVIDIVRSVWVLGVCAPYTLVALLELAWLAYMLRNACVELASVLSTVGPASEGAL